MGGRGGQELIETCRWEDTSAAAGAGLPTVGEDKSAREPRPRVCEGGGEGGGAGKGPGEVASEQGLY